MNRLEVGKDGKVAYDRAKGKKPTVLGVEFGEKLLYKVKPAAKLEKINSRWEFGIFVGVRRRSGEVWVAVKCKVFSARSVRRIPVEHRWGEDCLSWVDRVPWNRYKEALDADGDVPEDLIVDARPLGLGDNSQIVSIETKSKVPREFYIQKEDLEEHGYTRGCGGCSSVFRGLARQPHNDVCREKLRGILKGEGRCQGKDCRM